MELWPSHRRALVLFCQGKGTKEIVNEMGICEHTFYNYLYDIRKGLGATTNMHAVVLLLRQGIITLEDFDGNSNEEPARYRRPYHHGSAHGAGATDNQADSTRHASRPI